MRINWIHLTFALLLGAIPAAYAATGEVRIAAIVNDEVISTLDLQDRVELALVTSGKPDTPEVRREASRQLLQVLITERLRLDEAERFSITVSPDEVDAAIRTLEEAQGKPPGALSNFIREQGLSLDSLRAQVKSQVAWQKLVARKMRREVSLSDEEIARAQKRMAQGKKVQEVQVASIVLPQTESMEPDELEGIARDIRSQLMGGADAPALLQQYSKRVPIEFGPMTWVPKDQLNPAIRARIDRIQPGQIAEPVRTPLGFQIIRLLDTRTVSTVPDQNAEVALKQIVLKLDNRSSELEIDSKMDIARSIARHPGSCQEMGVAGLREFDGLNIDVNYIRTTLSNMAPDVRYLVEPLGVTGITEPFASEDGIHMLMLCERILLPPPLPDREQVRQVLFEEKLQLEAEKYLRQLRREAFIDVRV